MTLKELVNQAQDSLMRGELQSALENFQAAVTFCSEHAVESEKKLPCLANTGACLVTLGRYEESLSYLQEALRLVEVVHSCEEPRSETDGQAIPPINHNLSAEGRLAKGDITYNVANAYMGLERYREASADCKVSIDSYLKAGAREHAAEGFVSLSRCERHLQQTEGEIQSLRSAQQLYSDLGSAELEGTVVGELLLALLACKRMEEVERCMGSAKLASIRMTKPREKGHLLMKMGLVKASQGEFPEALEHLKAALPLLRSSIEAGGGAGGGAVDEAVDGIGDEAVYYEASILQNIGAILNETGSYNDAVAFHQEAAKLHKQYGSGRAEARCHCNQAVAETRLGQLESAEKCFQLALERGKEEEDLIIQFQAFEGLGSVCYQLERQDVAKDNFENAIKCLERIGGNVGLVRERVLEKIADVIEAQILAKEKQFGTNMTETGDSIDGLSDNAPTWFTTTKKLPPLSFHDPLTTSTPMGRGGRGLGTRAFTLPPLNLGHLPEDDGDDVIDGLGKPRLHGPIDEDAPLQEMKLNFTAESVMQEVMVYDPRKKTLASEDELGKTFKSLSEFLTSPTAEKMKGNRKPQRAAPPLTPTASVPARPESRPGRDLDLQRAYLDTYADSDSSVSVTPDSFTEEFEERDSALGDVDQTAAGGHPLRDAMLADGTNSPSASLQQRIEEGSLAIGPNAREHFMASEPSRSKKNTKQKREPIRLKSTSGEDEPDIGSEQKRATTNNQTQSRVCIIL